MKKILLGSALTALLCNANAEVDQSLTGLHVGLGINVLFDEYSADVDVAEALFLNADAIEVAVTQQGTTEQGDTGDAGLKTIADAVFAAAKAGQSTVSFSAKVDSTPGADDTIASENGALTLDNISYLSKSTNFKRRATNVGGELKLAYFHDFGNKFMIGVDLSGTIVSKTKKHVKNPSFAKQAATLTWTMQNNTPADIGTMDDDGKWTAEDGVGSTEEITFTAGDSYGDIAAAQAANPGASVIHMTEYNHIKNTHIFAGDKSEVSFEKDAFIPRLAFVLGGTYLGWFAGVRLGMAYMTGKVTATDANGSHSKSVSISSPFIGLHLMKQMNIKGINNGHVYVTADWHVGDGHRAVNINGIKSFKQNAFNLAAGLTWRCKLGR